MPSTTTIPNWIAGGVGGGTYIGFYDEDGLFCGGVDSLAEGESSEMSRWRAIKQADLTIPQGTFERQSGDDQYQASIWFPPEEPVEAAIVTGIRSQEKEAMVQGIKQADNGQIKYVVINPIIEEPPLCCLLVNAPAKEQTFGVPSKRAWAINILNQGQIEANGPDTQSARTLQNYQYRMVCDQTFEHPWGEAYTKELEGTVGGAGIAFGDIYRLHLVAFRTGSTTATITLSVTPRGDHTTDAVRIMRRNLATDVVTELTPGTDFEVDPTNKIVAYGTVASPVAPAAGFHDVLSVQY